MKYKRSMITIGILFICSGCNHTSKQIEIHPNVQKQSEQVSESLSNFSISTFASLFHEHENLLYAPFPAYVTLVQTMCDARQETKTEIMQVLRYDGEEDTLITQLASTISSIEKKDVLHSANSIWYHPDVHISSDLLNSSNMYKIPQLHKRPASYASLCFFISILISFFYEISVRFRDLLQKPRRLHLVTSLESNQEFHNVFPL